jgi:hypothetical protein
MGGFDPIAYSLAKKAMLRAVQDLAAHRLSSPLDHPDGSVTDAKVASVSRSKVSDLFASPFWANIPDKPSAFPPEAHASRHEKGGADPISVLGAVTADSISSPLLSPGTDFIVAQPIDADSVNTLRNSPDILLRGKYWTGTASANLDAEIRHVMLSTAPTSKLSFMFGGAEKAYLDNAGNMSVAGSATISGNATVKGTLSVGDLEFKNGWRIAEDERYGLVLISPSGRKFRLMLEVVE